jgi:hypothetical protein
VYALAGQPQARTFPASYLYLPGRAASLNDVTSGSNGHCESARAYLCNAAAGYDGPAGWGTPAGVAAFAPPAGPVITVADPGNRDVGAGRSFTVTIQALDSAAGQHLTYSAAGLPKRLSISPATGRISGTLPAAAGTFHVTVTATDQAGAHGSASFRIVVVASLRAAYHKVTGPVRLTLSPRTVKCLTDAGNSARDGTRIDLWPCDGKAAQQWTYTPDASPEGAGKLIIHGKCLTIAGNGEANGSKAELLACNGSGRQEWSLQDSPVTLANPASGRCLDDPADLLGKATPNGTQADIFDCMPFLPGQAFTLPPGPVMSAIPGMCVNDPGGKTTTGTPVTIAPCTGSAGQKWDLSPPRSSSRSRTPGSAGSPRRSPRATARARSLTARRSSSVPASACRTRSPATCGSRCPTARSSSPTRAFAWPTRATAGPPARPWSWATATATPASCGR